MGKYRALVIEDDDTTREHLAKYIQSEGYDVDSAENGEVGVKLFEEQPADIVIVDYNMDKMDGMEVMYFVKKANPSTQVILITGYGETDLAITALCRGALDYIKKPLDLKLLDNALQKATDKLDEIKALTPFPVILIAEDEDVTRKRLARILEKEGWTVEQACDGEEALNVFKTKRIDIALLDIKMPKKDGLTLLHDMRKIGDIFEAIIMSGHGDENSAIQALRDGASYFIKKPIDLEELLVVIEKTADRLRVDRSVRFHKKELVMLKELFANISDKESFVMDMRGDKKQLIHKFAREIIDAMSTGLFGIDADMNVIFYNKYLEKLFEQTADTINESFLEGLKGFGIALDLEIFKKVVATVFNSRIGTIKTIKTGQFSYVTLTSIAVMEEGDNFKRLGIVVLRGER